MEMIEYMDRIADSVGMIGMMGMMGTLEYGVS